MSLTQASQGRLILLGRVLGALGLRGEVKIESWTAPRHAIFRYPSWVLQLAAGTTVSPALRQLIANVPALEPLLRNEQASLQGIKGRESGKFTVAMFPGVTDREGAEAIHGLEIYIARSQLPPPSADEFYWVDLEGLRVVNLDGVEFGRVDHLFSTGSNDVLVVQGDKQRLIPFIRPKFVTSIDMDGGLIIVDWDPDF